MYNYRQNTHDILLQNIRTGLGLFWDDFPTTTNSEWDLDPPTHFHSNLEFFEFCFRCKAPYWPGWVFCWGRMNLCLGAHKLSRTIFGRFSTKGMFLYSAVSIPLDRSKRFTLHPWQTCSFQQQLYFSGKHSSHAATTRDDYSLQFHRCLARYSFIQLSQLGCHREIEHDQTSKRYKRGDSNPGALSIASPAFCHWATALHATIKIRCGEMCCRVIVLNRLTLCLPKTEISVFQRPTLACQRRRFPSLWRNVCFLHPHVTNYICSHCMMCYTVRKKKCSPLCWYKAIIVWFSKFIMTVVQK